ncbi:MAG: HAD-IA family hydrolase [Candidatus Binataceae bacterium]
MKATPKTKSHPAKSHQKKSSSEKNPKALLFDFGGTLAFIDYELLAREFSRPGRKLDALGLELAEYRGRAMIDRYLMSGRERDVNLGYEEFFREWLGAAGIPAEEIRECGERFQKIHREATLWRVVRPGTHEALDRLKRAGYKLAIVSNAEGQVEGDAQRFGLAEFFDTIIDSHIVGVSKPDPRIFQIALERLGIAPDEARYAGDIYSIDMLGARAAGIEGRLIDQHDRYDWVDHAKIRHVRELHVIE